MRKQELPSCEAHILLVGIHFKYQACTFSIGKKQTELNQQNSDMRKVEGIKYVVDE